MLEHILFCFLFFTVQTVLGRTNEKISEFNILCEKINSSQLAFCLTNQFANKDVLISKKEVLFMTEFSPGM